MPECHECGNTARFDETVEAHRTVAYESEGGIAQDTPDGYGDVLDRTCVVCGADVPVATDDAIPVTDLAALDPGDQLLWTDQIERAEPATVLGWVDHDRLALRGPRGGDIQLTQHDDGRIARETGSTVENLRIVGTTDDGFTEYAPTRPRGQS